MKPWQILRLPNLMMYFSIYFIFFKNLKSKIDNNYIFLISSVFISLIIIFQKGYQGRADYSAISLSFAIKGKNIFNIGSDNVKSLREVFEYLINNSNSKSKIKKYPKFFGITALKFLYFLKIISLGPYHQRMLTSNLILNTSRIKKTLNWKPLYSNEEMLLDCYNHYLSTISYSKNLSSSKKIPNLKILKILNFLENII